MAYPTLRQNEVFQALYNQIVGITTFANNIAGTNSQLLDMAREDLGLYADTKVYISTDCLQSYPWGGDAEATNLLQLHRPPEPKTQTIVLDKFSMIPLTVDNYLTKRAFGTEGAFSQFNSAIQAWILDTKRVIESCIYNQYIGNATTDKGKQLQTIGLSTIRANASTEEEANRLEGVAIAQFIADLLVDMTDVTRDYNDYGFLRSCAEGDIKVIWNSKYLNKILKVDLPTIYNKDGLVDKISKYSLPARWFGRPVTEDDIGSGKIIGADGLYDSTKGTLRAAEEFDYNNKHYFPGDALATSGTYVAVVGGLEASSVYIEDGDVVCKVYTKLPVMASSFNTQTSFFNPRSLTETFYNIYGRNTLQYFMNYPCCTIKA